MKKAKIQKLVNEPTFDFPTSMNVPGVLYQWCCDCGLRHVWYFVMSDDNKTLYIDVKRDDYATQLRKALKRIAKGK